MIEESDRREDILEGCIEIIACIYRAFPNDIEYIVEDGLDRGLQRFSPDYEVDEVSISIQKRSRVLSHARQQMDDDEPLSDRQIRALLQQGAIDPNELQEYVQSQPKPIGRSYRRRIR
jgi:hypothetical protein